MQAGVLGCGPGSVERSPGNCGWNGTSRKRKNSEVIERKRGKIRFCVREGGNRFTGCRSIITLRCLFAGIRDEAIYTPFEEKSDEILVLIGSMSSDESCLASE